MAIPGVEVRYHVDLKTRRAQQHLDALESVVATWLAKPPYSARFYDSFQKNAHVWRIEIGLTPEEIPMLVGDFICCLRSSLDQLAWGLAHTDNKRVFSEKQKKDLGFLIHKCDDSTYRRRLALFPPAMTRIFDHLQPYRRGDPGYREDFLWILDELWKLDKHRSIPVNSNSIDISFPLPKWDSIATISHFDTGFKNGIDVTFPLTLVYQSPVKLEPSVSFRVLFGEFMGQFEVSMARLREIHDFVANDVIPRFTGFLK